MRSASRLLTSLPPPLVAALLVGLQLAVVVALGRGQGWQFSGRDEVLCAVLLSLELTLFYTVANLVTGRIAALCAGLVFVGGPVVLAKRYFISGGGTPPTDFRVVYRHDVLPTAFGLTSRAAIVAACLLLASACLVLARTGLPSWTAAALAGGAAAAAALVYPHAWLAVAAPMLAALAARKPGAAAAAASTAVAGLVLLAVFRTVPHVPLGWHRMGATLDSLREFSWSRRILEYIPLAGLVGLAKRSAPAAAFFGTILVALVILPLARPLDLTHYLTAIVPGLPVYWLLTASLGFLVPRKGATTSPVASTAASAR